MQRVRKVTKAIRKAVPERRLRVEYVPVGSLVPWDGNPRRNDRAAERLAETIREHGFIDPIVATRADRMVRAGHARLKAAKIAGMEEVPVIFVDFPSEASAQAYSLADNRAAEVAEWDAEALGELFLGELEGVDPERAQAATGFTADEIEGLKTGWLENRDDSAPPGEFPEVDEDLATEHRCPKCGYEWSGRSS